MNLATGWLERQRTPSRSPGLISVSEARKLADRARSDTAARMQSIVSAYYTATGSGGVMPEREYWQLVDAYKSWVYTCIDKISKSIAMIPLRLYVYRSKQTGKVVRDTQWKSLYRTLRTDGERQYFLKSAKMEKEEILNHPFLELINRPNDLMTRFSLWYNTGVRLELGGLCGWLKVRDGLKVTRQIYPLPLTKYAKLRAKVKATVELEYWEYQDGDVYQKFLPEDVFVMIYPHPASPFQGMSPLMAQIYPYDIDLFLMQQQRALFQHGATPGLNLHTDQYLQPHQVDELKEEIDEQYAGALQAGGTLITHSGLKGQMLGRTGRDNMIDIVERFARDKLITSFDLSPGKIGLVEDVNRANMLGLDRTFIHECLRPKCMLVEEAIETFFLSDYDKGLTCDFELPATEDQELELKAMETRLKYFVTNVDQERQRLGMEEVEWGKKPWIPYTMAQPGTEATKPAKPPILPSKGAKMLDLNYWTDERKDIYWKVFVSKSEKLEQMFLRPMKVHFKMQVEEVVRRLEREGKKILGQYAGWSRQKVQEHLKANRDKIRVINIDKREEKRKLKETFLPIVKTIMKEQGDDRISDLTNNVKELIVSCDCGKQIRVKEIPSPLLHDYRDDMDVLWCPNCHKRHTSEEYEEKAVTIEFNVDDPRVVEWLGSRMRTFSDAVSGTTFDEIEAILWEGFSEGLSIAEITGTLREKFDSWDEYRAPLIARTETLSAMSLADLESVRQMGLEDELLKHWMSARDNRCRPTHAAADAKYSQQGIAVDEDFEVGADRMPCPGNGSLPEENINCRCVPYFTQVGEE
jgi:phage portal protein BeeE